MERIRSYEAIFIVKPNMEDDLREELSTRIKNIITDNDGEIVEVEVWGDRKLAYEIKDFKSGYYTLIEFKSKSALVDELERNFKIIDDVLRYLVIRKED